MSSKTEQVNELQDALLIQQACMEDVKIAAETVGSAEEQKAIKANINQAMTQIKEETENLLEKRRKINKHLELSLKPQLINLSTTIKAIESVAERKLEVSFHSSIRYQIMKKMVYRYCGNDLMMRIVASCGFAKTHIFSREKFTNPSYWRYFFLTLPVTQIKYFDF